MAKIVTATSQKRTKLKKKKRKHPEIFDGGRSVHKSACAHRSRPGLVGRTQVKAQKVEQLQLQEVRPVLALDLRLLVTCFLTTMMQRWVGEICKNLNGIICPDLTAYCSVLFRFGYEFRVPLPNQACRVRRQKTKSDTFYIFISHCSGLSKLLKSSISGGRSKTTIIVSLLRQRQSWNPFGDSSYTKVLLRYLRTQFFL